MDPANNHQHKAIHVTFLAILPRIELHARIYFRFDRDADKCEEAIAEVTALAWKWFLRLTERGKDVRDFVSAFATYVARAVRNGRRVCGQQKSNDVMSPFAQQRHQFAVQKIPDFETLGTNLFSEALADNTVTPPSEQAAFRVDFASWLGTRTDRDRQLVEKLMIGERTSDVARRFRLTPSRISQLGREFFEDWHQFCGEEIANPKETAKAGTGVAELKAMPMQFDFRR